MKESFGFIERADVVKEIFFHFSETKTSEELRLGDDVEFIIQTRHVRWFLFFITLKLLSYPHILNTSEIIFKCNCLNLQFTSFYVLCDYHLFRISSGFSHCESVNGRNVLFVNIKLYYILKIVI